MRAGNRELHELGAKESLDQHRIAEGGPAIKRGGHSWGHGPAELRGERRQDNQAKWWGRGRAKTRTKHSTDGPAASRTHSPVFEGHAHAGTAVGQGHRAFPLD